MMTMACPTARMAKIVEPSNRSLMLWALRNRQFEDPKGDGERVLSDRWDDHPRPATPPDTPPD